MDIWKEINLGEIVEEESKKHIFQWFLGTSFWRGQIMEESSKLILIKDWNLEVSS